ncbi:MAG: methyltransferase [Deltaproteobacteria bacterium]|nr:methyltransferase [Deltaproteobacteria bacterium]
MTDEGWNPGKLLGISGNYWMSCALQAGVKLDIFTIVGNQMLTGQEIAQKINGDQRGLTMLLNALAAMNLLVKKAESYANIPSGYAFLSKESPQYIGHIIRHHHHLMESWAQLDKGVLSGKPVRTRASFDNPEVRESFLMGMFNMAMQIGPRIAEAVDLSNRRHLLDLGGGPGTYAIHFCLKNPDLRATVYDLSSTRPFAEKTIARFGLTDRVTFQEGNYTEEDIRGTFDVVWLSQILHAEGPDEAQKIIQKAVSILEPDGLILIHDFLLNNHLDGPLFPALFSLNMLLGTAHGQSYSELQITEMLAKAGIREIHRLPLQTPNDSGVIQGKV